MQKKRENDSTRAKDFSNSTVTEYAKLVNRVCADRQLNHKETWTNDPLLVLDSEAIKNTVNVLHIEKFE